jgi:TonB family protein
MQYSSMQFATLACACAAIAFPVAALGQEAQLARPIDSRTANCPQAEYPKPALRSEVDGLTVVALTVDATGQVSDVQVVQKSGETALHALLDAEAVRVTRSCRFAEAAGMAPARARLPYRWRISD